MTNATLRRLTPTLHAPLQCYVYLFLPRRGLGRARAVCGLGRSSTCRHSSFFAKMPRVKPTRVAKKATESLMSDDAGALPVAAAEGESAAPAAEFAEGCAPVEAGAAPVKPKSSRKPKPCKRCDERREREREYARLSRVRARLTKSLSAATAVAAAPTPSSVEQQPASAVEAPPA